MEFNVEYPAFKATYLPSGFPSLAMRRITITMSCKVAVSFRVFASCVGEQSEYRS